MSATDVEDELHPVLSETWGPVSWRTEPLWMRILGRGGSLGESSLCSVQDTAVRSMSEVEIRFFGFPVDVSDWRDRRRSL
jgi:hypothetical protein